MSQLPLPTSTATTPALQQFTHFPDLPGELKLHVLSFLDRSTLQNACLASHDSNIHAQVALTSSLAEELSRYDHAAPGSDLAAFNRKMGLLIQRNPIVAIQTLKRIQANPANNTDAILGFNLLKACLALKATANNFVPEKVKLVLTTTVLDINNLIPPLPSIPLDQTQMIASYGDRINDTIFDTLTRMSVGDAISAALHKISPTKVATSEAMVQVEALRKIASVCISLGKLDEAQNVIKTIAPLDPNNYYVSYLNSKLCEALVKKGELDQALSIAEGTMSDMFTYQSLRSTISIALVEKEDFSAAARVALTTRPCKDDTSSRNPHYFRITNSIAVADLLMRNDQPAAHQAAAEILHHMLTEMCAQTSFNYLYYSALKKGGSAADLLAYSKALPHENWEYKLEMLIQAAKQQSEKANLDTKIKVVDVLLELQRLTYNANVFTEERTAPTANQLSACYDKLEALLN